MSDVRFALRSLRRSPGFVIAAVLCLGLGLGANTTVYGIVNALLLRPLPYARPERLVGVSLSKPTRGIERNAISMPYFLDVRERSRTLTGLVAYATRTVSLAGREGPEAVKAGQVSAEFFAVLGVTPIMGRAFRSEESAIGAPPVAVLGEALWRSRFGADPHIVGTSVTIDGAAVTVVGVAPARVGVTGDREVLWMPLAHDPNPAQRGSYYLSAIGRMRDGASLGDVRAEMRGVAARIGELHPGDREWMPRVEGLRETLVPEEITIVFAVMMGAVGFVLLIACANVANLLLARTSARQRELAVRSALGARRARIVRLVLAESLLVALAGGLLGTGIAYVGTEALVRGVPVAYPAWIVFTVDGRVSSYAFAMSLLTGLVFGLLPALRASRPQLARTLRNGGRGASAGARRLRATLVVGELALSLVLLVGAGLMIRSFLGLQASDPGFEPHGALAGGVYLSGPRFATGTQRGIASRALLERAAALPGVERAALISAAPLSGWQTSSGIAIEGRDARADDDHFAEWRPVSSGALGLLRIPIVAGRDVTPTEAFDSTSTVVVVNERLAHRYWPDGTAIGKRLAFERGEHPKWLTIVGVSRDIALGSPGERPRDTVWRPWATAAGRTMTVLVRARSGDAAALAPAVRRAVAEVDPTIAVVSLSTLDDVVRDALWLFKLYGWLFGAFAAAALVLAVVGVYGVIAYQVAQRTRELGVRVALGARPTDVYRLVVGDGARLAGVGLVIGLVLAVGLTRVLRAGLRGVSATDPLVFGLVTVTLAGAALLACWIPARRATRVDPLSALRNDG